MAEYLCIWCLLSNVTPPQNRQPKANTWNCWFLNRCLCASNCVQFSELVLGFVVRYTNLPQGCVSWLTEWNRARCSVSDVTPGYTLLMYPAVYLLTYLRGGMVLGYSNRQTIINQIFQSSDWPHINKYCQLSVLFLNCISKPKNNLTVLV